MMVLKHRKPDLETGADNIQGWAFTFGTDTCRERYFRRITSSENEGN